MPFDIALNLVWACLSLLALAGALRVCSVARREAGRSRWLLVIGVALIVVALFPYVSATDDVLRIDRYTSSHSQSNGSQSNQGKQNSKTNDLVRLFETIDTPILCRVAGFSFVFVFFALVAQLFTSGIDRSSPFRAVRSPPLEFSAI